VKAKTSSKPNGKTERPVMVTTSHRGIFTGYTTDPDDKETITLVRARMVVYYSADAHSVVGIAKAGPGKGARVSPSIPKICLRNITSVAELSPEAVKALEAEPWS
jgi:hypothetical protein